jgi:asparagine synthase (glutamine-hydrolysing)
MCGICGIFGADGRDPAVQARVRSMCDAIVHRGPDEDGYYFDDAVALGMRRLSIIDLQTGRQPIANEDKTVWTVYNGEIYNFPVLKAELEAKGHRFATRADTEVIVHLYEEHGAEFVHKLNGMFAIALWDKRTRTFILTRDRIGVKPLHYWEDRGRLVFGSEIKSLLRAGAPREIDLEALSQYVTFEYIPAPRSIFKGIGKLLPGHILVAGPRGIDVRPYWDVRYRVAPDDARSEEAIAAELRARLKESVRMRLISDVPLGVFLSGGMDSSAVTALMSEVAAASEIKTFSIGFKEKSFDELGWAGQVARHFGTKHTEFVVESSMVKDLVPVLMRYLDEPLADASIIPTYIISKLAREHVTVALAGDGGDELFAGYDTYKAFKWARLYRKVPRFLRNGLVKPAVGLLPASAKRLSFEFKAKKFIAGVDYPPEIANTIWWGAYPPAERRRLLSPDFLALLREDPFAPIAFHLPNDDAADPLDRVCYLDLKLYLQDDLLVKVDRMSMANSLEIRVPFLDFTFVDFATAIPNRLKLKGMETKYILKKAIGPSLPPAILKRPKIGFDIPLGVWMREELRDFVQDVLAPERLNAQGYFDSGYVRRILKEHMDGSHNHRQRLWPLVIFQFWHDHYLKA